MFIVHRGPCFRNHLCKHVGPLGHIISDDLPNSTELDINVGALIGIIAAPWMLGQVVGGLIGASLLTSMKASVVRALLITILFGSSLKLVARGIESLTGIEVPVL